MIGGVLAMQRSEEPSSTAKKESFRTLPKPFPAGAYTDA